MRAGFCGDPSVFVSDDTLNDGPDDDKVNDGIKLTVDAHRAGQLEALRDSDAMLGDLMNEVEARRNELQALIATIQALRDTDG